MEIDEKYKIDLEGFAEQDFPWQCPESECNTEMETKDIIGFGSYPQGGFRSKMKPNCTIGVGFECPKCFAKSVFHGSDSTYQMFLDSKKYV